MARYPRKSAYLREWYSIDQELSEFMGDLEAFNTIIDRIRELGESAQEKYDNLPEGMQESYTGTLLENRRDECAELAQQCESIAQEWDDGDLDAADVETDVPFLDLMRIKIQEIAQ